MDWGLFCWIDNGMSRSNVLVSEREAMSSTELHLFFRAWWHLSSSTDFASSISPDCNAQDTNTSFSEEHFTKQE